MKFDKTNNTKLFNPNKILQIGDKVLLISKDKAEYFKQIGIKSFFNGPGFIDPMFGYCNKIATITFKRSDKKFLIDIDGQSFTWHTDFVEKIIDN